MVNMKFNIGPGEWSYTAFDATDESVWRFYTYNGAMIRTNYTIIIDNPYV